MVDMKLTASQKQALAIIVNAGPEGYLSVAWVAARSLERKGLIKVELVEKGVRGNDPRIVGQGHGRGSVFTLNRYTSLLVKCTGEAHGHVWIDHCPLCAGLPWGWMAPAS